MSKPDPILPIRSSDAAGADDSGLSTLPDALVAGEGREDFFFDFDLETDPPGLYQAIGGQEESAVRDLLWHWPEPVMALSHEARPRIIFWNKASELMFDYSPTVLTGSSLGLQLLCPETAYLERKLTALFKLEPMARGFEWTLTARNGRRHRLGFSRFPETLVGPGLWLTAVDLSQRLNLEQTLRGRDRLLRNLFKHLPDMAYLKDGEGRWLLSNPAALAMIGFTEKEVIGKTNLELAACGGAAGASLEHSALSEEATWQSGRVSHLAEVLDDGLGGLRSFDVVRVPNFDRRGERQHMLVIRRDVTDQRHAATKLELAGRVLDQSTDGILISDADHQVMMVNLAFSEITGYAADEVIGRTHSLLADGQHDPAFLAGIWDAVNQQGRWSGEVWNRRKSGEVYPQWLNLSALRHRASGEITHYVAAISDLSLRKAAEEKIAYLSTQDVVTGLPNRTQVTMRADLALSRARLDGDGVALMVVDVDNFKTLNDSLGHAAGDQLLREVGQRLSDFGGGHAVVGRLSGDEFLLMQSGVKTTVDAAHVASSLMQAVARPVTLGGLPVNVSISVGIALFPSDGDGFDALFGRADAALYEAKRGGRAAYQFASTTMNAAALERLQLESALRSAIESQALRLEYQPLIELGTGRMVGVEALCRWHDPERGPIAPSVFIPLAEDSGLIEALGGWVLRTAAQQLKDWHEAGHLELMMSVNLSARQFRHGLVLQQVEEALVASGLNPAKLELELTESVLLHDGEAVMSTLRQLKALGVKLSIDDFGTGYSSFAYLRRFKFDKIKIDQSFVRDLIDDPDDAAIVRGIISLALSLGLHVLAEGVESEVIAQRLRHMQCTYAQGYHFARPLRPKDLEARFLQKT